eukprot:12131432-Alexandrium_andersonii.AAC.1
MAPLVLRAGGAIRGVWGRQPTRRAQESAPNAWDLQETAPIRLGACKEVLQAAPGCSEQSEQR